jgi:hypothetical protein
MSTSTTTQKYKEHKQNCEPYSYQKKADTCDKEEPKIAGKQQ